MGRMLLSIPVVTSLCPWLLCLRVLHRSRRCRQHRSPIPHPPTRRQRQSAPTPPRRALLPGCEAQGTGRGRRCRKPPEIVISWQVGGALVPLVGGLVVLSSPLSNLATAWRRQLWALLMWTVASAANLVAATFSLSSFLDLAPAQLHMLWWKFCVPWWR